MVAKRRPSADATEQRAPHKFTQAERSAAMNCVHDDEDKACPQRVCPEQLGRDAHVAEASSNAEVDPVQDCDAADEERRCRREHRESQLAHHAWRAAGAMPPAAITDCTPATLAIASAPPPWPSRDDELAGAGSQLSRIRHGFHRLRQQTVVRGAPASTLNHPSQHINTRKWITHHSSTINTMKHTRPSGIPAAAMQTKARARLRHSTR
jgi:hypothetical protein